MAYGKPDHLEYFSCWSDFVDKVEKNPHPLASISTPPEHRWDLGVGLSGSTKLAREGWPEGEQHIKRLSLDLFDKVSSLIERDFPVYDIEGSEIDVARYLDGEPECWLRMETHRTEGPGRRIVRLVYNASASAGINADVLLARGAAVAALIELLEFAGIGVELTVVDLATFRLTTETRILVKPLEQPLDIPRIAYALAHPAMLRRSLFAISEQFPAHIRAGISIPGSYGAPADTQEQGDLYFGKSSLGDVQWSNPIVARAWIISQLKKQGVCLKDDAEGTGD